MNLINVSIEIVEMEYVSNRMIGNEKIFIELKFILRFSSAYCLCTSGYQGINCRTIDSCAYNPCANNGRCEQLSSTGDFLCQCLPNYSDRLCQTFVDLCQVNQSLCSSTEICIPKENNEYDWR